MYRLQLQCISILHKATNIIHGMNKFTFYSILIRISTNISSEKKNEKISWCSLSRKCL